MRRIYSPPNPHLTIYKSCSINVFTRISSAILRSNIRWHGQSSAASVPSSSFKPRKGQKKIPKQDRHALAESFVDKYRASNAGRFPTVSQVQREIGGSYYIVRQIIQELEYNHRVSPLKKIEEVRLEKAEKVICPSSGTKKMPRTSQVKEISSSIMTVKVRSDMELIDRIKVDECQLVKDDEAIADLEAREESAISDSVEKSFLQEKISQASTVINPLNEQILGGSGDPSISNVQVNIKLHGKDVPSRLAEQCFQGNGQDSFGGQESNASSDRSTIAPQANVSVSLKSEIVVDTLNSPTGIIEGSEKDKKSTEHLQNAHGPGVEQIRNQKAHKSEELGLWERIGMHFLLEHSNIIMHCSLVASGVADPVAAIRSIPRPVNRTRPIMATQPMAVIMPQHAALYLI